MFIENQIVKLQQEINNIMNDISWSEDGCTNLSWSERGWIISEMDELIGLIDSDSSFKDIEVAMKQIRYNAEYGYDIYKSYFEILIKLLRIKGDNTLERFKQSYEENGIILADEPTDKIVVSDENGVEFIINENFNLFDDLTEFKHISGEENKIYQKGLEKKTTWSERRFYNE